MPKLSVNGMQAPTNVLAGQVVEAALEVHKALGPGLLTDLYRSCLIQELRERGLKVERDVPVAVQYKGLQHGEGLWLDLLVGDRLVVHVQAEDALGPVHEARLRTHLHLAGKTLGLLVNFDVTHLRDGLRRVGTSEGQASSV